MVFQFYIQSSNWVVRQKNLATDADAYNFLLGIIQPSHVSFIEFIFLFYFILCHAVEVLAPMYQ